eukprot:NODE_9956_length_551_cov_31.864486_g9313_i0.p1 GENE.NODE_9956_length_551_cov_31.864486_g9313_i0~~NODE_9956_length_551_cov_31.864486_g9313_i0.p1  ORF type:complete len:171 (+),score=21.99 NODE_9956_length_551_cov_31.864486_g9313_i0:57-515(+)
MPTVAYLNGRSRLPFVPAIFNRDWVVRDHTIRVKMHALYRRHQSKKRENTNQFLYKKRRYRYSYDWESPLENVFRKLRSIPQARMRYFSLEDHHEEFKKYNPKNQQERINDKMEELLKLRSQLILPPDVYEDLKNGKVPTLTVNKIRHERFA